MSQSRRGNAEGEDAARELDRGGEATDEVASQLAVDSLDTQLVGEIAVVEAPKGSLKIEVECAVGLHFKI
jgi:hypothetical protein